MTADNPSHLVAQLVSANHILAEKNVLDAYGHLSARTPADPSHFLLARSIAPAQVSSEDIVTFDLSGEPVRPVRQKLFLERFIHSEIYKARPDVTTVLHCHSPALIPFCNSDVPLRAMTQPAGFLGIGVPAFDLRTFDAGADLLIRTPEQGCALALTLACHAVVLIRGHGAVVTGNSIKQIVWRGIYSEINARQQIAGAQLGGDIRYLSEAEASHAARTVPNDPDRAWNLWLADVRDRREDAP